ncbi:sigma-70 family RNA polymerase sigma factor [Couchioplanes caeruleus]|uniref:RNA polymerase sigma-70 factor (ECF subfamily) n=1 Tax=Couchioplanes caeruleus TaxID=56438 RepID=A0A3N1GF59_9ACTN|nr:sigma-70 family RNA polymerase sigma factor [Couchioplanes caeruleus]ROP28845.1 RNA polymerase sigma-70 factor (ECF subfamily) [Couchioplanes caeruleus]
MTDSLSALAYAGARGDHDALSDLIRATQQDVSRFLARLSAPGDIADLTQETYLRAIRALPDFAGRSSVRTWLFAIARRVAADHVRTAVRRPRLTVLPEWRQAADTAGPHARHRFDEYHALTDLLARLDPDRREAFQLTQVAGLSYAEAADACGCPIGTIRSRVARAREDLISAMDNRAPRTAAG